MTEIGEDNILASIYFGWPTSFRTGFHNWPDYVGE